MAAEEPADCGGQDDANPPAATPAEAQPTPAEAQSAVSPATLLDNAACSEPQPQDSNPWADALSVAAPVADPDSIGDAEPPADSRADAPSMAGPDQEEKLDASGFEDDDAGNAGVSPDLGQTLASQAESVGSGGGAAMNDPPQSAPQTPAKASGRPATGSSEGPTSGTRSPKGSSAAATGGEVEDDYEEDYEDDFDETMTSHNASRASGFETDGGDDDDDAGSGFEDP